MQGVAKPLTGYIRLLYLARHAKTLTGDLFSGTPRMSGGYEHLVGPADDISAIGHRRARGLPKHDKIHTPTLYLVRNAQALTGDLFSGLSRMCSAPKHVLCMTYTIAGIALDF